MNSLLSWPQGGVASSTGSGMWWYLCTGTTILQSAPTSWALLLAGGTMGKNLIEGNGIASLIFSTVWLIDFKILRLFSCKKKSRGRTTPCQIYKQVFWMKAWGHSTAKRTFVLSNNPRIQYLDSGRMTRQQLSSDVETTIKYVSKDGRKRFKGSVILKQTEYFG